MAAIYKANGIKKGDRVLIYMPMIAEACFAMLACARIGAIHSVVFGGFASHSLASRIDDAKPKMVVTSEAGMRGGKAVPYKPLLDEAITLASYKPEKVLIVNRGLSEFTVVAGRDLDYASERQKHLNDIVPVEWVDATHPSYILYTSGTTGKPKGVQRDTGGYAVALMSTMNHIFCGKAGETMFTTSDIGWVVGHSYIIYGPLLNGMGTIMYEGTPLRPDAGIWWELVAKYKVSVMFSAPTAVRVLKKQDPAFLTKHDLSTLRALFLAGEPLDEPTASWIHDAIKKPIVDNYWQTETGWPMLAIQRGVEVMPHKFGSPGVPSFGYNMKLLDDATSAELGPDQKGVIAIEGPLPPGCMQTVWGDDKRFISTYWETIPGKLIYSTFDWGIKDKDGYFFILGRTDDVINVAGHRLGTREIEESISSHPNVSEVAVVGIEDKLKGQAAIAFVIPKNSSNTETLEKECMKTVDSQLGAIARPGRVYVVTALPKTRSGKIVRRALQAVAEGRDPGDISTMEDQTVLAQIKTIIEQSAKA
jgi:propionyl-CoA synthetase